MQIAAPAGLLREPSVGESVARFSASLRCSTRSVGTSATEKASGFDASMVGENAAVLVDQHRAMDPKRPHDGKTAINP